MRIEMRNDGSSSSEPGNIENHFEVWEGRFPRKGSAGGAATVKTFETAWGLNQASSQAPQPGPAAAAAGLPVADGGGGGGTDAQVIELAREISAMEAQIEQLKQRNGILEIPIRTPNSKFASAMNHLEQFGSSLPKLARPS